MILVLLLACRQAELVDACLEDPALCPACERDADCVLSGHPCLETVDCAHRDAELSTIQIGCSAALEYARPPPESCACVETVWQSGD